MSLFYSSLDACYDKHGHIELIEGAYCPIELDGDEWTVYPINFVKE